jgi:hypothetical protein
VVFESNQFCYLIRIFDKSLAESIDLDGDFEREADNFLKSFYYILLGFLMPLKVNNDLEDDVGHLCLLQTDWVKIKNIREM